MEGIKTFEDFQNANPFDETGIKTQKWRGITVIETLGRILCSSLVHYSHLGSMNTRPFEGSLNLDQVKMEDWAGFPLTTLCIWNKYKEVHQTPDT